MVKLKLFDLEVLYILKTIKMKTVLTSIQLVCVTRPTRPLFRAIRARLAPHFRAIRARLGLVGRALRKGRYHAKLLGGHLNELGPMLCMGQ